MPSSKIQTGLRIDKITRDKLTWISERECRSLNSLIERIVRMFLEQYEREHGPIPIERPDK